jgi:hypothetical protein
MGSTGFALDTKKDDAGLMYLERLRDAFASGKGFWGLISDVARLGWGPGRLQANEYFLYRLFEDDRVPAEAKKTFLGSDRLAEILHALDMPWPQIANDKPTLTALLAGYGLPIPETQAMRHRSRTFPGAMALRTKSEVEDFLRREAVYPIFGKPTNMMCSLGVSNLERYDRGDDSVVTKRGQRVQVADLAHEVEKYAEHGYLFQTRLTPHPDIVNVVGDQLSTVRMFVLADDQGPALLRASWKIPGGESVADNFWRSGNMLGGLDVQTGTVLRVLRRTRTGTQRVEEHPQTGASFRGLTFPHWDQMRAAVMQGAAAVPSCHFQGWDVALTDRGPILVELEGDGGDPIMEQLCFDTGLLQGRYLAFAQQALKGRKQRKKKAKDRLRARLRANFSQLVVTPAANVAAGQCDSHVEQPQEAIVARDG